MTIWIILLIICVAGAIGGVVNALLSENGFALPKRQVVDGFDIIRPGLLGNVLIGSIAAGVSWGLYGPLATYVLFGDQIVNQPRPTLTLSALFGAVLVGVAGAKWLTNEVDKNLLKAAATTAAMGNASSDKAQAIALSSPVRALEIAQLP